MKIQELFEKISVSNLRVELNSIVRQYFDPLAGKLELFTEDGLPLPNITSEVEKIKKIEPLIASALEEYDIKNVVIQGMPEHKFYKPEVAKGSYYRNKKLLELFIPYELVNKHTYFGDSEKDKFYSLIIAIILHEVTHAIQRSKQNPEAHINNGRGFYMVNDKVDYRKYFSSSSEIEAHAVNTAEVLMTKFGNDKRKILFSIHELLQNEDPKDNLGSSLKRYHDLFKDEKTWRRYLKKLYQHILDFE